MSNKENVVKDFHAILMDKIREMAVDMFNDGVTAYEVGAELYELSDRVSDMGKSLRIELGGNE